MIDRAGIRDVKNRCSAIGRTLVVMLATSGRCAGDAENCETLDESHVAMGSDSDKP